MNDIVDRINKIQEANNGLVNLADKLGFNKGYHQAIEDMVSLLRIAIIEPGRSLGTRNVLEVMISEARILDLNNARKNNQ